METESFLLIIWLYLAILFIAVGLILQATKLKEDEHSRIFERGNEWYAGVYVGAIAGLQEEMDAWVKK